MGTSKFTILGEDGSGKTCYLLGMYYAMSMDVVDYMVVATDPYTDRRLTMLTKMLEDKSRGRNRFPAGTDQMHKYNFNLWYEEIIHSFEWIDYPGGFLDPRIRYESSQEYQEFKKFIMESEMLFICIDGANLVGSSTQKKIRNVRTRCAKFINPYLAELCHKRRAEGRGLPPIGMLVTKYDMCADDTDADEVREIVEEAFDGLFYSKDIFVAVIPVSLGATLEDDDCQGDLDPLNVHFPVLMGINFALSDKAKRQKDIYKSEKHMDIINRMNRELATIDMIYYKGAWQDKHRISRIWTELYKIMDYQYWRR